MVMIMMSEEELREWREVEMSHWVDTVDRKKKKELENIILVLNMILGDD